MSWKQGVFNVLCNLIAVAVLEIGSIGDGTMDTGHWEMFFDFKLNYFVFFVVVNFLFVMFVTNKQQKKYDKQVNDEREKSNVHIALSKNVSSVLKDIADNNKNDDNSQWGYGKHLNCAAIPKTETWQQWINTLVKVTGRPDLEGHNFGDFFYLYDFATGEKISFPKEKSVRESVIGSRFPNGKIFRVMPKK